MSWVPAHMTIEDEGYDREQDEENGYSSREREENDRLDYANKVAETDPDRAAEIRAGA